MPEYYANPKKHDFRFTKFSKNYHGETASDTNLYTCTQCGATVNSETLFVMDRTECPGKIKLIN